MSDARQVKVDNWGIYFLQRLKHFFNRTDYCDLTLQFQDNAQLKVHRLVLSACTEYFELLERTCEMYEDCLVMPDDLQADVVVPIINFMYTGQLEFKMDLLEKLYQTSLIMNLPILTKLLDAHRPKQKPPPKPAFSSTSRENSYYGKRYSKTGKTAPVAGSSTKRSYSSAFSNTESVTPAFGSAPKMIKPSTEAFSKAECIIKNGNASAYPFPVFSEKNKRLAKDPRPTRYELPEELDEENLFDNSFTNLSYTSKPLMVHPETATKQYGPKKINLFEEGTSSSRFMRNSANDIVECRKISANENIFLDPGDSLQDESSFQSTSHSIKDPKDNSQLFDQILENKSSKITIETKNSAQAHNLDHAKIISEVLKKYPHLVKSNKNIKLKILNTTPKNNKKSNPAIDEKVKPRYEPQSEEQIKPRFETPDFTYESDVINSKEAAKLIALGAENIAGPWICLICGTPGKALHFTSYYNFRKHLVEIHNEKPIPSICEYCGVKSQKRNYIVHHKLTKHGVTPPPAYNFPKCNHCSYIALNEALLIKHKTSHSLDKSFKFNLPHVQMASIAQKIGKKYPTTSDKNKSNMQCVYCMRNFSREQNLYAHLKINHKEAARNDGLIDDSEEEQEEEKFSSILTNKQSSDNMIKLEVPVTFANAYEEGNDQYQIEQNPDGSICVSTKKPRVLLPAHKNKQQILNLGFGSPQQNVSSVTHNQKQDPTQNSPVKTVEVSQNTYQSITRPTNPGMVIIDNAEYIIQDNHLIPKKEKMATDYVISHASNDAEIQTMTPTTSVEYQNIHSSNIEQKVLLKKSTHMNQPYQIVVSSEEEYKALINSNQTVLYAEAESNKELSELEVPDNTTIETGAIDLDNTQSNDNMMIIPDYHMDVPDTVDNSNIVVVYSHPVEDQNKQYSIITTQGEFIQPTAIITQNYETVTTCSPVVTSHTVIEDSWQNNGQDNVDKLPMSATELQTMAVGESITIAPMENVQSNSLNELTEVQLTSSEPIAIQVAQTETCVNTLDASNIITTISQQIENTSVCQENSTVTLADSAILSSIPQQVQSQSLPSSNDKIASISLFDQATSVSTLEEQATTADEVTSNSHELETVIVQQINDNLNENNDVNPSNEVIEANETSDTIIEDNPQVTNSHVLMENAVDAQHQVTHESAVQEEITEEDEQLQESNDETQIQEETIENIAEDNDESQNALNVQEQCIISDQAKNEVPFTKIAKAQIENLTSEWSEDENEVSLTGQNSLSNAVLAQNDENAESADTEESIENIQKELEKQVPSGLASEEDMSVTNDTPPQTHTPENLPVESQEKISSLLNDWEDNDSQEEGTPVVPNEEKYQNQESVKEATQDENMQSEVNINYTTDKSEIPIKSDNIKNLVSDWDEDDDEEENND